MCLVVGNIPCLASSVARNGSAAFVTFFLFCFATLRLAANDLKLIVGSDMGQEAIDKIFKEFDLNHDGEIDFK